jgi:uncharacterized linocin/CFP29 family protein
VQPLVELRVDFRLVATELDRIDRGGHGPDLTPLTEAAIRLARAEDRVIFHGLPAGGPSTASDPSATVGPERGSRGTRLPERSSPRPFGRFALPGSAGRIALAAGDRCFTALHATTARDGYLLLDAVQPDPRRPDRVGAGRGRRGRREYARGRPSPHRRAGRGIGYLGHSTTAVQLFLVESSRSKVLTPEAAVWLTVD